MVVTDKPDGTLGIRELHSRLASVYLGREACRRRRRRRQILPTHPRPRLNRDYRCQVPTPSIVKRGCRYGAVPTLKGRSQPPSAWAVGISVVELASAKAAVARSIWDLCYVPRWGTRVSLREERHFHTR